MMQAGFRRHKRAGPPRRQATGTVRTRRIHLGCEASVRSSKIRLGAAATVLACLGAAASGCQSPAPFVHAYREFDRSSENFRREPANRGWVTVCAPTFREPDAAVAALAEESCQKHGKAAVEAGRQFGVCPLLAATAVVYRCTSPTS
jgi:hypothetical protein